MLAPGLDELAVLGILHDAIVGAGAMTVGDVDVAIGRNRNIGGAAEIARLIAGHAGLADRHQHLAVRAELDRGATLAVARPLVGCPHIAVAVYAEAVREIEQVGAEADYELSGRVEFHDRG